MLFVALFAPWFTIKTRDYSDWDDDEPEYKWNSYDYSGEGYGDNDEDDEMEGFFELDSMDNGKMQGFFGIILGMVFGIGLIVLGNIHLVQTLHRKLMVFFRGATGIVMLLPAIFLMVCGSKFIGVSIFYSTSGRSDSENAMLCIVPYLLFIVGIIILVMAFGIIKYNFRRLSGMKSDADCVRVQSTEHFTKKFSKLSTLLVVFGMLAVVTLPLLPIVSETEGESSQFWSTGFLLDEQIMDGADFADYLGWVNFAFWFIFFLALIALLAVLFLKSGINDLTGYILGLIPTLIALFLLLAFIFKILFIVDTFSDDYEDMWYGYNYLPLLVLIGLIIICILYMIHTIKGSTAYFKSMPRRPAPVGYGAPPPRRDDYYHGGQRKDDYYGDRKVQFHGDDQRRDERDYPPPPF